VVGFFAGVLPGGGGGLASYTSYALEKKVSKAPQEFGRGAIQGVAGPEASNNAGSQGAFIPLLTLGIPANSVTALLVGALMIHGVQPGPQIISHSPDIFWGVITSMYLGNAILLVLNLPLIGMWVRMLRVPYRIMFPVILLFCMIGVYSMNNSIFEIYLLGIFGIIGYFLSKLEFELAPMILAFVLGPMMEDALKQSLLISQGDLMIFVTHPISAFFLGMATLCIFLQLIPFVKKFRALAMKEDS
jgi:putative tricarboxylic transport membrane protein